MVLLVIDDLTPDAPEKKPRWLPGDRIRHLTYRNVRSDKSTTVGKLIKLFNLIKKNFFYNLTILLNNIH